MKTTIALLLCYVTIGLMAMSMWQQSKINKLKNDIISMQTEAISNNASTLSIQQETIHNMLDTLEFIVDTKNI